VSGGYDLGSGRLGSRIDLFAVREVIGPFGGGHAFGYDLRSKRHRVGPFVGPEITQNYVRLFNISYFTLTYAYFALHA
jgi:hypothetical protein